MAYSLPKFTEGLEIPKLIHQTFYDKTLPPAFQANVDRLRALNPDWQYQIYDDADIATFITEQYGPEVLAYFNRINPRYGAAKADLFRYLLLYRYGGVYLDIKSSCTRPLNDILQPGDRYLLANWRNKSGEKHAGWGMQKELAHVPGGEFQQWHIIAAPGHPFLRAVIERVFDNIDNYNPWRGGTGGTGVLRLTGPIAYTLAIHPLLGQHAHRMAYTSELSLEYTILKNTSHKPLFKSHYMRLTESVVRLRGVKKISGQIYSFVKRAKRYLTMNPV